MIGVVVGLVVDRPVIRDVGKVKVLDVVEVVPRLERVSITVVVVVSVVVLGGTVVKAGVVPGRRVLPSKHVTPASSEWTQLWLVQSVKGHWSREDSSPTQPRSSISISRELGPGAYISQQRRGSPPSAKPSIWQATLVEGKFNGVILKC